MFFKKKKTFNYHATKTYFEANREIKQADYLTCPDWVKPVRDIYGNYVEAPDAFYPLFDPFRLKRFYTEGKVALGALVQANTLLFSKGKDDLPANYIYSTDDFLQRIQKNSLRWPTPYMTSKETSVFVPACSVWQICWRTNTSVFSPISFLGM